MKTMTMALIMFVSLSLLGTLSADAQSKKTMTAQELIQTTTLVSQQNGLINISNVPINVSNITVQDLVNVQNVLNNAQIDILNNSLNNIDVDVAALNNVLRDAKLLNKNQIVVGVLSDQDRIRFVTQNARAAR
jgi:hypothetical protein